MASTAKSIRGYGTRKELPFFSGLARVRERVLAPVENLATRRGHMPEIAAVSLLAASVVGYEAHQLIPAILASFNHNVIPQPGSNVNLATVVKPTEIANPQDSGKIIQEALKNQPGAHQFKIDYPNGKSEVVTFYSWGDYNFAGTSIDSGTLDAKYLEPLPGGFEYQIVHGVNGKDELVITQDNKIVGFFDPQVNKAAYDANSKIDTAHEGGFVFIDRGALQTYEQAKNSSDAPIPYMDPEARPDDSINVFTNGQITNNTTSQTAQANGNPLGQDSQYLPVYALQSGGIAINQTGGLDTTNATFVGHVDTTEVFDATESSQTSTLYVVPANSYLVLEIHGKGYVVNAGENAQTGMPNVDQTHTVIIIKNTGGNAVIAIDTASPDSIVASKDISIAGGNLDKEVANLNRDYSQRFPADPSSASQDNVQNYTVGSDGKLSLSFDTASGSAPVPQNNP